jgi:O-acetyl-ADP-ribose deacetylase (regulator of RNase III)
MSTFSAQEMNGMVVKKIGDRVVRLVVGDITDMEVAAFVYDITEDVKLGSGYGAAIVTRGGKVIQEELDAIGCCRTAEAIITSAGKLKADRIIHVNGPKFHEPDTEDKLRRSTLAALELAEKNGITQLAFPPIGTGLYQVPLDLCARVMIGTVTEHLANNSCVEEVVFVALDAREFEPLAAVLQGGP